MSQSFQKSFQLLVFGDLTNFVSICKSLSDEKVFSLLQEIAEIYFKFAESYQGKVIKFMGDGVFMTFPEEKISSAVSSLFHLKEQIEDFLLKKAIKSKLGLSVHYGEIVSGNLGNKEFPHYDVIGQNVNTLFLMNGKPFTGRLVISPQAFRKLSPEARKSFHKFTPQIYYVGE